MKRIIKNSLITGLITMCLVSNVYATEGNKVLNKTISKSEENSFLTNIEQEYIEGKDNYKLLNYSKEEDKENTKSVTAYKTDIIDSNKKENIIEHFGENLKYDDGTYSGTIPLKDYEIRTINNGKYEVIDEKKIDFNKYSKNDLNNIEKEKYINGTVYYLINVIWENDEVEIIDNQEVPINYKGTMIYQTVLQKNYPFDYEITVSYEGIVNKTDPIYLYTLEYEKVEETIVEEDKDYIAPAIIVSGLGLAIIILYMLNSKTAKIYAKTDKGYKLIKIVRLSKKHNQINLSKSNHRINSNVYAIKTSSRFFNKNTNMLIKVKKDKILKNVYLNSAFVDFILG